MCFYKKQSAKQNVYVTLLISLIYTNPNYAVNSLIYTNPNYAVNTYSWFSEGGGAEAYLSDLLLLDITF